MQSHTALEPATVPAHSFTVHATTDQIAAGPPSRLSPATPYASQGRVVRDGSELHQNKDSKAGTINLSWYYENVEARPGHMHIFFITRHRSNWAYMHRACSAFHLSFGTGIPYLRCLILSLLCLGAAVAEGVPFVTATGDYRLIDRTEMLGYEFTVNHQITVTGFAKFDGNKNGLLDDRMAPQVGLWDAVTNELITSTFIDDNLVYQDDMFVAPIDPFRLPSGRYTVAVQNFNDQEPFAVDIQFDTPYAIVRNITPVRRSGSTFTVPTGATFSGFGPNLIIETPDLLLTEPSTRSVAQRTAENDGSVFVKGVFDDSTASTVELRVVSMDGDGSDATPWQSAATVGTSFSGHLDLPAAGWYRVEARSMNAGQPVSHNSVSDVGLGEVFVIAGQSNSANFGETRLTPQSTRVLAMDSEGVWSTAKDPQPIANGTGGSPWPAFGDRLVEELDVPIGMVSVGWGGTSVAHWLPGAPGPDVNGPLYNRLQQALERLGPNGARAILWHQGEADSFTGRSRAEYAEMLNQLIAHSREDAGYDILWGVAQAAYLPGSSLAAERQILAAQRDVIQGDPLVFAGALTDDLIGSEWRFDAVHFNEAGLRVHADRWAAAVVPLIIPEPAAWPMILIASLLFATRDMGARRLPPDSTTAIGHR